MDWLNYHHLYYFWVLNREGSFTKASQKLRISQSTVSEQVQQLEVGLGVPLLDRSQKKVLRLTEVGLSVLDYAQTIFETGNEMLRWIKSEEHRHAKLLRLGVQSGLSRALQIDFLRPILNQPEYKIEIVSGDQERLLKLMNDYKIDMILMSSALDERFSFRSYSHLLASCPVCIVSSTRGRSSKKIEQLLKEVPIYLPSLSLEIRVQIDAYLSRYNIKPQILGEMDDVALLRLLALSTSALVFIPKIAIANDLQEKKLRIVHEFKDIKKFYYAITRQIKFPNPICESLIKAIRKE